MSQSSNPVTPQQVASLLSLATQFLKAGRPADAIAPLREAALLQPSNPVVQHDLGLACLEVGSLAGGDRGIAAGRCQQPTLHRCIFPPGNRPGETGQHRRGNRCVRPRHGLLPSLTEAWFRAGALAYTLGHRDKAIGCFRRAAASGGKNSFGRLARRRALLIEDRNQEAEQVLRQTLVADPTNAMAYELLGNLLSEFGRFEEARACFERAISLAPLLAGSYYDLIRCRPVTSHDDGLLQGMEVALATPGLESPQRLRLHLAIGKAAEDLGDYALAMQHFDAADAVGGALGRSTRQRSPSRSTA